MTQRVHRYVVPVWLCGRREELHVYEEVDPPPPTGHPELLDDYFPVRREDGLRPALGEWLRPAGRREKHQIVIHWTGSNNPARGALSYWSSKKYRCDGAWRPARPGGMTDEEFADLPDVECDHEFFTEREVCPNQARHPADTPPWPKTQAAAQYVIERMPASYGDARIDPESDGGRRQGEDTYPDIIEAAPSTTDVVHANNSRVSIGIELSNLGDRSSATHEDFGGVPAHDLMNARSRAVDGSWAVFQALQAAQYHALALLVRHLSMKHHIRRQFLGRTLGEKFELHRDGADIATFRGLYGHLSSTSAKVCGGVSYSRNRIYRLITDEWWLPVQLDGAERLFTMFPFAEPGDGTGYLRFRSGQPPVAETFAQLGGAPVGTGRRQSPPPEYEERLAAYHDTTSHFDPAQLPMYYAVTEVESSEGTFPIGRNAAWHGGVHLPATATNDKVYAAASGRIVAARVTARPVEGGPAPRRGGSVGFVLIRHHVHLQTEGSNIRYRDEHDAWVDPTCVHTLYMHVDVASPGAEHAENPPWVNELIRANGAPAEGAVVCPDLPVLVGDWLGQATRVGYQERALHFEVLSKREVRVAPFDDDRVTFHGQEDDGDILCELLQEEGTKLGEFFQARGITIPPGEGPSIQDVLDGLQPPSSSAAAPLTLRNAKVFRRSDWALDVGADAASGPNAIVDLIRAQHPGAPPAAPWITARARQVWHDEWQPYMWVRALREAGAHLEPNPFDELFDADGRCWHYHPITFMSLVNRLVAEENGPERMSGSAAAPPERTVTWESWVRPRTQATQVRLDGRRILARFADAASAAADAPAERPPQEAGDGWWVVRADSAAESVSLSTRSDGAQGLRASYATQHDAAAEQEDTRQAAWPVQAPAAPETPSESERAHREAGGRPRRTGRTHAPVAE